MTHARHQIRDAIITSVTGLTQTGSNVFRNRIYPVQSTELPAILIGTESEIIDYSDSSMSNSVITQHRMLEFTVTGKASVTANIDNTLDQIALEVEEAIYSDPTLGGLVKDLRLNSTNVEFLSEGEQPIGSIVLLFECLYRVADNNSDVIVN